MCYHFLGRLSSRVVSCEQGPRSLEGISETLDGHQSSRSRQAEERSSASNVVILIEASYSRRRVPHVAGDSSWMIAACRLREPQVSSLLRQPESLGLSLLGPPLFPADAQQLTSVAATIRAGQLSIVVLGFKACIHSTHIAHLCQSVPTTELSAFKKGAMPLSVMTTCLDSTCRR